jgi:glutamate/tyrosine decarboxylase-like PLP-dependent enzyme
MCPDSKYQTKSSPVPSREEIAEVVDLIMRQAKNYLDELDTRPVRSLNAEDVLVEFKEAMPEVGEGTTETLRLLIQKGFDASVTSAGPRCFHFVIGGTTPAALGADWLATALDQIAFAWISSPLSVELEILSLSWLKDLFGLPTEWGGIMTTGATMANFVGFAAARQWYGDQLGVDVAEEGMAGIPGIPVFSSGYIHASAVKALAMLGIGRSAVRVMARDDVGRLDVTALEEALRSLDGAPAVLVGNAGEVNAGDFDPIETLAELAEKYNAWLHVDGAFGLFARVAPETAKLAAGIEGAHSVTVDGHKWLNVPYDCGFGFVNDPILLGKTFAYTADYLPKPDDPRPNLGTMGPESSRRARSLAVWATLRSYGREGYREMVEGHLVLARRMAKLVDDASDLERLAEVLLNIVCFRFNPGRFSDDDLNRLNTRLGDAILSDGRVYAGTTLYKGMVALRPAIVNWRTREEDIEFFVEVVRELGKKVVQDFK